MTDDKGAERAENARYMREYRKLKRQEKFAVPETLTEKVTRELESMPASAWEPGLAESCRQIAAKLEDSSVLAKDYVALARELRIGLRQLHDSSEAKSTPKVPKLRSVALLAHRIPPAV